MTDRHLAAKHAIVTGAGRGIGLAVAEALARAGADVTLMARTAADVEREARRLGDLHAVRAGGIACDVTSDDAVRDAFARAADERGGAYVLVNNAGIAEAAPFAATDRELWDRTLAVNLGGTYACTQAALPAMLAAGAGRIVNVASTAGLRGYRTLTAYCAAKHAIVGLTRALAQETARHGITVNAVCPGYTDTSMTDAAVANVMGATGKDEAEARRMLVRIIPRGALTSVDEVASAVAWLCSPGAAAVTGAALPVAGGEVN